MSNISNNSVYLEFADGGGPTIKLVIWDMDDTFWSGTISEGDINYLHNHHDVVIELAKRGIVSSICSKNELAIVKARLELSNIWDYFVFPKIAWVPKGQLIKQLIEEMQLRPENVLFIDDNRMNLEEARFYNNGIQIALPECLDTLLSWPSTNGKSDPKLSRLNQYRVLEKKSKDRESFESNNVNFLLQSEIKVIILKDCIDNLSRIVELIERANQLNFTKRRSTREDIESLLHDRTIQCGYIKVSDKYGDYGICGFYALKNDFLVHFTFSCRAMNMGVEQWLYRKLGRPNIEIIGEVSSDLLVPAEPDWITETHIEMKAQDKKNRTKSLMNSNPKILMKGGCDLEQVKHFLGYDNIFETEFNYNSKSGMAIHREHTENLRQSVNILSQEQINIIERIPFLDKNAFSSSFFSESYDVYIYSVLMDYTQGLYRFKGTELVFGFGDFLHPLTNCEEWPMYLKNYSKQGIDNEFLSWFQENFEFLGAQSESRFRDNLEWILDTLPKEKILILLNGAEIPIDNPFELNRHEHHRKMNTVLDQFVRRHDNVFLVDARKHVKSESDIESEIRHYRKHIYFQMSNDIKKIVDESFGIQFSRIITSINYLKSMLRYIISFARVTVKNRFT